MKRGMKVEPRGARISLGLGFKKKKKVEFKQLAQKHILWGFRGFYLIIVVLNDKYSLACSNPMRCAVVAQPKILCLGIVTVWF